MDGFKTSAIIYKRLLFIKLPHWQEAESNFVQAQIYFKEIP